MIQTQSPMDKEDYFFFTNRALLPTSLITFSTYATIIGASSTVGLISLGAHWGFPACWWLLSGVLGLYLLRNFLLKPVFHYQIRTISDLIRLFYGKPAEIIATILICASWIAVISAQLIACGKLAQHFFPVLPSSFFIPLSALIIALYIFFFGQQAVFLTDLIQGLSIMIALVLLSYSLFIRTDWRQLFESTGTFFYSPGITWLETLSLIAVLVPLYLFGPDIFSRFLCADKAVKARRSLFYASFTILPLAFIIPLIGMSGNLLFHIQNESLFFKLLDLLGSYARIVVIIGFLCAFLSSADTSIMTATQLITFNIIKRHSIPQARITLLFITAIACIVAIYYQSIIQSLLMGYKLFSAGFTIPLLVPLITGKKYHYFSAISVMITGAFWVILSELSTLPILGIILICNGITIFFLTEYIIVPWIGKNDFHYCGFFSRENNS